MHKFTCRHSRCRTIRMVQGIYIHHKDHIVEFTIFTPWSKSVTPFPSLRKKLKAFKEDSKRQMTLTWVPLVSTPTTPPRNPRKHAPGKARTQWTNHNHCFNPIKTNGFNILGTNPRDINKINIIKITPQKVCECFEATCSFCRQQVSHPLPDQSDWSSKDWDGDKAKTREQNPIVKFDIPRPKPDNSTLDSVDSLPFQGLTIWTDRPDEKAPEVLTILIPPIEPGAVGTIPKDNQVKLNPILKEEEELTEQELRMQKEEEKYNFYISQLRLEDSDTDMETDGSDYSFLY